MTIRQVVEETDTLAGRVFDLTVQALVLLSIASFSIETLPGLSPRAYAILDRIVHTAHRLELDGPTMRKIKADTNRPTTIDQAQGK